MTIEKMTGAKRNKYRLLILCESCTLSDDEIIDLFHSLAISSGKNKDLYESGEIGLIEAHSNQREAEEEAIEKLEANKSDKEDPTRFGRLYPTLKAKVLETVEKAKQAKNS